MSPWHLSPIVSSDWSEIVRTAWGKTNQGFPKKHRKEGFSQFNSQTSWNSDQNSGCLDIYIYIYMYMYKG